MKPRRRFCPRSRWPPPALNHAADRCAVSAEPEECEPKFTAPHHECTTPLRGRVPLDSKEPETEADVVPETRPSSIPDLRGTAEELPNTKMM